MANKLAEFARKHKKVFIPVGAVLMTIIIFQVFYPSDKMLPIAQVDGLSVGGWSFQDVADKLNQEYNSSKIKIYFGKNVNPHSEVSPSTLGIQIGNANRINSMRYPWYMRLAPSSFLWYGLIGSQTEPVIKQDKTVLNEYLVESLGDSCKVEPVNASLQLDGDRFKLVEAMNGGTCAMNDVKEALSNIEFQNPKNVEVRIAMDEISPDITNDDARDLSTTLNTKLLSDVTLSDEYGGTIAIPSDVVRKWIDFAVVDKKLRVAINESRSENYYNAEVAPKVTSTAGVTVITTSNLTDIIRSEGSDGRVLNIGETNRRIVEYLTDERQSIAIALTTIFPGIEYASQFDSNSAGIEALMKYYAETHDGTFGIKLVEFGGQMRSASYNAGQEFEVAGAGRLLIGYSMLSRQEQGLVVSRDGNDDRCIREVVVNYATNCVDASVYGGLNNEARYLGMHGTNVVNRQVRSTADDLTIFMEKLYSGRLGLHQNNNWDLYGLLQGSQPRNGIAGSVGIDNINATGEKDGVLSDTAVVFSADSVYTLTILCSGGSWQNISELANQIQGLISKR